MRVKGKGEKKETILRVDVDGDGKPDTLVIYTRNKGGKPYEVANVYLSSKKQRYHGPWDKFKEELRKRAKKLAEKRKNKGKQGKRNEK